MPPLFINPEEDERAEETLSDPELAEYTIKQEKDETQVHKFWQMFKQLHINITLADALILISKYQKMLKSLLSNKEKLLELANTPLNENCSAVILKKLPEKLRDPGKFLISYGFSELKCKALADLGRPFLRTAHAFIDVYGEEMTLRDGDKRVTLNMRHDTSSYSNQPHKESINMINIYDDSYEDYLKDLFVTNHLNSVNEENLTDLNNDLVDTIPEMFTDEHTLNYSSPPLYDNVDDDLIEFEYDNDDVYDDLFDSKGDKIKESKLLIDELDPPRSSDFLPSPKYDSFLFEDFFKDLPPHLKYVFLEGDDKLPVIIAKDLSDKEKTALIMILKSHKRAIAWKLSDIKAIDPEFCTHKILMEDDFEPMEKSHFMVKEGIVLGHKISKNGIKVDKPKVNVISKLPHPTTVKGIRSFLGHAGFYQQFIQDFLKIARPITRLLEKDNPFFFSKECVEAFQTLKRKLTEAPILIAPDWDFPFELMCDASDFAIGAVLGKRQEKHFRPIHYASKTMTEAESNYTTKKKKC
nr:reverse transcriptase domain-containing protein [Tanacetum cinerariifolium]